MFNEIIAVLTIYGSFLTQNNRNTMHYIIVLAMRLRGYLLMVNQITIQDIYESHFCFSN